MPLGLAFKRAGNQFRVAAHFEPALAAKDVHPVELAGDKTDAEVTRHAVGKLQQHGRVVIHINIRCDLALIAERINRGDHAAGRLQHRVERMNAARGHAATGRLDTRRTPAVTLQFVARGPGVMALNLQHIADFTGSDTLHHFDKTWRIAPVETETKRDAGRARRIDRTLRRDLCQRHGLLDVDRLAGLGSGNHLRFMMRVRRRQHHGIDTFVGQHRLV